MLTWTRPDGAWRQNSANLAPVINGLWQVAFNPKLEAEAAAVVPQGTFEASLDDFHCCRRPAVDATDPRVSSLPMGTRQPPRSLDSQSMIFDILFVVLPSCKQKALQALGWRRLHRSQ